MEELKKQWLPRGAAGGLAGLAAHVLLGYLLGCFSLIGPAEFTGFRFPDCGFPRGIEWVGVLFSFVLFALLGAEGPRKAASHIGGGLPAQWGKISGTL